MTIHISISLRRLPILMVIATGALMDAGFPVCAAPDVVLAENGQARAAIYVMPETMTAKAPDRLCASIEDLARCLRLMSGAEIPVLTNPPTAGDLRVPILVGARAEAVFGKPKKEGPGGQGWRLVVSPKGVGMIGQSDLAVSYAIYELLDRFGCRWFLPGPLGEDIPNLPTLSMPELDISEAPVTASRGLRYADEDFSRRNRMGGVSPSSPSLADTGDTGDPLHASRCPAHSLLNTNCPAADLACAALATNRPTNSAPTWRDAGFNPGELTAPLPLMRRWSEDIPFLLTNGATVWLPDTRRTFGGSLPGLYLGCRLAWYPHARPKDVLDEFFVRFYGAAAPSMREFWDGLDQAWSDTPDHSANAWGYLRRFTPGIMARARRALDQAAAAAQTDTERNRVALADAMFGQFERFMRLRQDLAEGRLAGLETDARVWLNTWTHLAAAHANACAFEPLRVPAHFRRFLLPTYQEASRLAATVLTPPLRTWRYTVEGDEPGERLGWPSPEFQDADWATTDSCVDTWSALGLWSRDATVWYRARLPDPPLPEGRKVYLWLSAVEGTPRVYVNGQPVQALPSQTEAPAGHVRPVSFDITAAVQPGRTNHLAMAVSRALPSDPGAGGLLGPAFLYHEITSP